MYLTLIAHGLLWHFGRPPLPHYLPGLRIAHNLILSGRAVLIG